MKDVEASGAAGGAAGVLLATARAARELSVDELAASAGCPAELVSGIESGRVDPTLDTVNRIVNGVALEIRAGSADEPNPNYETVTDTEVERVRREYNKIADFRKEYGIPPLAPAWKVQPEWDGIDPAPPHLFGAGATRNDGGGWAALLMVCEKWDTKMTSAELAEASGFSESHIDDIETGRVLPPISEIQKIYSSRGAHLSIRLEPYDDHDDGLHLSALADPERYERQMQDRRELAASAVVLR